jgi:hypothetical protein
MSLDLIKLVLTLVSGICWTTVYIEGIRLGLKEKTYAIPFYALALNISWELLHTFYGLRAGWSAQAIINAGWFVGDIGILYTYFKFGRKYFPRSLPTSAFLSWSVFGLVAAAAIEYAFVREFGITRGAGYSAFLQNLLMSILFIDMLVRRGSSEGQSLSIAVNKWIGTLAPTILFGFIGHTGFPHGSVLLSMLGVLCSVFDLTYIWMLIRAPEKGRA